VGCRYGGPPMSAIRSWPERPHEARLKGGRVRFGQGETMAVMWLKFCWRWVWMRVARSVRGGGLRGWVLMGKENIEGDNVRDI